MTKNYEQANFRGSKQFSEQKSAKRSNRCLLHSLSKFLYLFSFIFILVACDIGASDASGGSGALNPLSKLGNWTQLRVASHFSARTGHSSVVLKNSKGEDEMYIIGGRRNSLLLDDIWKSADGGLTWKQVLTTGTKFSARDGHSSVVQKNKNDIDEIYVIGGYDNEYLDDVWKSADGGLTWTQVITSTGTKFFARSGHSSAVIGSDIYVIGGYKSQNSQTGFSETYFNDVWKSTDGATWTEVITTGTGTKFSARVSHSSVVLKNSKGDDEIYVIGGNVGPNRVDDVWKSADGGLTWAQVAETKFSARFGHSSVVVGSDIYVIAGGDGPNTFDDVWKSSNGGVRWDQVTKASTAASKKLSARVRHSSVVIGSDIYVIGGLGRSDHLNDVWKSTNGEEWVSRVRFDITSFVGRSGHSSVVLKNSSGIDEIYVIGGFDGANYLDDVWKSADGITWEQVEIAGERFSARSGHSSVVMGNDIYVIDGYGSAYELDDVWKSANGGLTWEQVITNTGTKFSARRNHSSVVQRNKNGIDEIYVIGGNDGVSFLDDIWKSADGGLTWEKVATTGEQFLARSNHSSAVIGNDMYVIGGRSISVNFNDVWKSSDGVVWEQVAETKFPARSRYSSVVVGSDIYVIVGDDGTNFDDVWKSANGGVIWTQVATTDTKISARDAYSSVALGNDIYVIGGNDGTKRLNDVWKLSNIGVK